MLPLADSTVIFQPVAEGAVLFSPSTEVYFGLNEVGARIWQLLPPACATVDDVCAALATAYPDTPASVIRTDVEELLKELLKEGLVRPHASPTSGDVAAG